MQNSFLELRCKFLRLLKRCPPNLKIEPHYPAACSRLNGNCSWPRLIIDNLEEAVSLFDLHNHNLPSLELWHAYSFVLEYHDAFSPEHVKILVETYEDICRHKTYRSEGSSGYRSLQS